MKKHKHGEAFMLMTYANKSRTLVERPWNSRDGVTPFILYRDEGKTELQHINWNKDVYAPDHVPDVGDRVFVDLTPEKAKEYATRRVEQYWDDATYPMRGRWETKEKAIAYIAKDMLETGGGGAPDVVVVDRVWLAAYFGSQV